MNQDNFFKIKTITPPDFELIPDLSDGPARHGAFENPGKIVYGKFLSTGDGGREFVVYWLPIQSWKNANLTRGVYAEMVDFQGRKYLVSGCSERPWPRIGEHENPQFCCCEMFRTFEEAYACFLGYIRAALDFINPFTWVQSENMNIEQDWEPPKVLDVANWTNIFRTAAYK